MRIIGGELRGRKLHSIRGTRIRPTADRLRESIFNILGSRVQEAVVLDLFAGSGALGIEALSRGAGSVVFIDNNRTAIVLIERNTSACAVAAQCKVIKWNIIKNLNCIRGTHPGFDLVFMDPPYDRKNVNRSLVNLYRSNSLKREACIIVEHSQLEPLETEHLNFQISDQRKYGKTLVSFLRCVI